MPSRKGRLNGETLSKPKTIAMQDSQGRVVFFMQKQPDGRFYHNLQDQLIPDFFFPSDRRSAAFRIGKILFQKNERITSFTLMKPAF